MRKCAQSQSPFLAVARWSRDARQFLAFLLLLVCAASTVAAQSWELGRYRMLHGFSSAPLRVSMNATSLRRVGFLAAVGGVAFEGVAAPDASVHGSVAVEYDPSQVDGYRLAIQIGSNVYHPYLPDWELVPIARFSDSRYHSVVSLFGPNTDRENFHVVYHPAFENTLAGMRLLQADMLLIDVSEFWQLPKLGGRTVLGEGESAPVGLTSLTAARRVDSLMSRTRVQSWVLTDQGVATVFGVSGDRFFITGSPYYYFWRLNAAAARAADSLRTLGRAALDRRDTASAVLYLERIDRLPSSVTALSDLTSALRQRPQLVSDLNPAVYRVASNAARFSAFFRYVKQNNPASWRAFLDGQLRNIQVKPPVTTPTQIPKEPEVAGSR